LASRYFPAEIPAKSAAQVMGNDDNPARPLALFRKAFSLLIKKNLALEGEYSI
jgi:hypothetical protein